MKDEKTIWQKLGPGARRAVRRSQWASDKAAGCAGTLGAHREAEYMNRPDGININQSGGGRINFKIKIVTDCGDLIWLDSEGKDLIVMEIHQVGGKCVDIDLSLSQVKVLNTWLSVVIEKAEEEGE